MNNEQKSEEDNEELNNERIEYVENIEPTDKEDVEMAKNKKKKCPRCRATMKKAGKIRAGSRGGLRDVYYCPKCGYKSL